MPEYVPDVAPLSAEDVRGLYAELSAAFSARNEEYRRLREFYRGLHWDPVENPADPNRYSLTLNYGRAAVDKAVRQIWSEMPGIQVVPPGTDEASRRLAEGAEGLLYEVWEKNNASKVFRTVTFNQSLLRRGFIFYWWDPDAECVKFRSVAPENVLPLYDGPEWTDCIIASRRNTRQLKAMYSSQAKKIESDVDGTPSLHSPDWFIDVPVTPVAGATTPGGELTGNTLVLDHFDRGGNWTRVMGNAVHKQKLGYPLGGIPIIEFPNTASGDELEPHGDVDDIVELNKYMDQLTSQQADIIHRYANPTILDEASGQPPHLIRQVVQSFGGVLPMRRDGNIRYLAYEGVQPDIVGQAQRIQQSIFDLSGFPAAAYGQMVTNQSGVMTNMSLSPTALNAADKQVLIGEGLVALNRAILSLYEKFHPKPYSVRVKTKGEGRERYDVYAGDFAPKQLKGWYENRIKWPSVLRTDDPLYVQTELSKMTSQPPAQSVYTTMENLGMQDVEAELDRVGVQLEDPRFNPQGLDSAVNAAQVFSTMPPSPAADQFSGLDPGAMTGVDAEVMNSAAEGAGSPKRDELVKPGY